MTEIKKLTKAQKEIRIGWLVHHVNALNGCADISNMTVRTGYQLLKKPDDPKMWMYVSWRGHVSSFAALKTVKSWMREEIRHHSD